LSIFANATHAQKQKAHDVALSADSSRDAAVFLSAYLNEVFPVVFRPEVN
jgi:hypothetical protein